MRLNRYASISAASLKARAVKQMADHKVNASTIALSALSRVQTGPNTQLVGGNSRL